MLCRAVLRTAHPSSVLSHISAAVELGASTWGVDLEQVHLTRTDGKAGRRETGIVHHRGVLSEDEVEVVNGVRVTRPARALIETCTVTDVEPALVIANSLLNLGLTDEAEVELSGECAKFWPGSLNTNVILRLVDARIESVAESRAFVAFWRHQIPRPIPQVEVRDESGRLVGRVDFAWPDLGAFAEVDGKEKYLLYRRPGESLDDFLMREKRREETICQMTGWVCIRITWADLARPEVLAQRIRAILRARQRWTRSA